MYLLKDEKPLLYRMFYSKDRNDSLKRTEKRAPSDNVENPMGHVNEQQSSCTVDSDCYLLQEYVDQWANATTKEVLTEAPDVVSCTEYNHISVH